MYLPSLYFWLDSNACSCNTYKSTKIIITYIMLFSVYYMPYVGVTNNPTRILLIVREKNNNRQAQEQKTKIKPVSSCYRVFFYKRIYLYLYRRTLIISKTIRVFEIIFLRDLKSLVVTKQHLSRQSIRYKCCIIIIFLSFSLCCVTICIFNFLF